MLGAMQIRRRKTPDGRYRFDRELGDDRWIGRALATKESVLLSELTHTDFSPDELYARYNYAVDGIAPIRAVIAIVRNSRTPHGAILVEAMPEGKPLYRSPVPPARRTAVALELARTTERLLDAGIAMPGLRPDLIIVGDRVMLVPRSESFLRHTSKRMRVIREYWSFDHGLDGLYDPYAPHGTTDTLIFQLGLAIAWIWTQRHPYADALARSEHHSFEQLLFDGLRHDPWPGPPEIDELLGAIFRYRIEDRPGIDVVLGVLERVLVTETTI